jgi:hypothetical protein
LNNIFKKKLPIFAKIHTGIVKINATKGVERSVKINPNTPYIFSPLKVTGMILSKVRIPMNIEIGKYPKQIFQNNKLKKPLGSSR